MHDRGRLRRPDRGRAGPRGRPGGSLPGIPDGAQRQHAPLPADQTVGKSTTTAGTGVAAPSHVQRQVPARKVRVTKRCRTSHRTRTRTCRYYRAKRLVKTCVRKRHWHRYHCRIHHPASTRHARAAAVPRTVIDGGFVASPMGAVVKIHYLNHEGKPFVCSGSLLLRGVVLTAGHCVYSNATDGDKTAIGTPDVRYYDPGTYTIVPGEQPGLQPYGSWTARNMWTTDDYARGVLGADWGLIELNPDASGGFPGDAVGEVSATWSLTGLGGDEFWLTGYPTSGNWGLPSFGGGYRQAFCHEYWYPDNLASPSFGAYYAMNHEPCRLTAGSSGGPEFARLSDGSWTVVAVNNRGRPNGADGYGQNMIGFWFDDAFGAFYTQTIAAINAGY